MCTHNLPKKMASMTLILNSWREKGLKAISPVQRALVLENQIVFGNISKGIKAKTRGNEGNCLRCLRIVPGLGHCTCNLETRHKNWKKRPMRMGMCFQSILNNASLVQTSCLFSHSYQVMVPKQNLKNTEKVKSIHWLEAKVWSNKGNYLTKCKKIGKLQEYQILKECFTV